MILELKIGSISHILNNVSSTTYVAAKKNWEKHLVKLLQQILF